MKEMMNRLVGVIEPARVGAAHHQNFFLASDLRTDGDSLKVRGSGIEQAFRPPVQKIGQFLVIAHASNFSLVCS
jgi:hypothetical protein